MIHLLVLLLGIFGVLFSGFSYDYCNRPNDIIRRLSNNSKIVMHAIDYVLKETERLKDRLNHLSRTIREDKRKQSKAGAETIVNFGVVASDLEDIRSTQQSHLNLILFNDNILERAFPRDRVNGFEDGHNIFNEFRQ